MIKNTYSINTILSVIFSNPRPMTSLLKDLYILKSSLLGILVKMQTAGLECKASRTVSLTQFKPVNLYMQHTLSCGVLNIMRRITHICIEHVNNVQILTYILRYTVGLRHMYYRSLPVKSNNM